MIFASQSEAGPNGPGDRGEVYVSVEAPPRLKLGGVSKSFPGVLANDNVNLSVKPGEIHALLGENGAGKSTLVKMIYGILAPDEGEIVFDGSPARIANPRAARRLGIGMVFQHFSLFEAMTVLENIALGLEPPLRARAPGRDQSGARALWPEARSPPRRLDAERRRAPAHRDRARASAQSAAPDHGRADLGADAAGGRAIVRDLAQARGERLLDPLHLAQAARDRGALRHRDDPARRQGGRAMRPEARNLALDGRDDDRREPQGNRQARIPRLRRAEALRARLEPAEAERFRRRAARRRLRGAGGRNLRRRRRRRQRTERTHERAERREARADARGDHARGPRDRAARRRRAARARPLRRAGGAQRPRGGRRILARRQWGADRAGADGDGALRPHRSGQGDQPMRPR